MKDFFALPLATSQEHPGQALWLLAILCFCLFPIASSGQQLSPDRGGIEFTLENASLVSIESEQYLSLDVMAGSPDPNLRLGTGIVLLNYNPQTFGENVRQNNNVSVNHGELITTSPFPLYNLIINDNSPSRLAVTFEYLYTPGGGGLLGTEPQSVLNILLKVLSPGFPAGISFQESMMINEQYMDDNDTLFDPVVAVDSENSVIPFQPSGLVLTQAGNLMNLIWQDLPNCTYSVYGTDDPGSGSWQLLVDGLAQPSWDLSPAADRLFFRVTAVGDPGRRQ